MAESWPGEQLIGAAQNGDADAIAALVSGSFPHVQRFARTLCASPQDAEDAAQEALIILYRKIGSLRATAALASWMFRIVSNECLRRSRAILPTRAQQEIPDSPAPEGTPEDQVLQRLDAERVVRAISALPRLQRSVLIMRDVQGYRGKAVADALGLSGPAMKSQLHRARQAVQQALRAAPDQSGPQN